MRLFRLPLKLIATGICASLCLAMPIRADEALTAAAQENRYQLNYDGTSFSGAGWEFLEAEASAADYFLIGEEHGIADNPKLAADLFNETGYEKLVIEVSPFIADWMDNTLAKGGLEALVESFEDKRQRPAFFGMAEEAEMLADVRGTIVDADDVLWGVDYEVVGDGLMLEWLSGFGMPEEAADALLKVRELSELSWAAYDEIGNPGNIFSFSRSGEAVLDVIMAWPRAPEEAMVTLMTLYETQEINSLFMSGKGWESNARRAALLRDNFRRHWRDAEGNPRVMLKLGASHLIRGRNMTNTYDLGTLVPEIAEIQGRQAYSMLVLPGEGSMTAVLDPTSLTYSEASGKDDYSEALDEFFDAAFEEGFTVFDLEALRPLGRQLKGENAEKLREVIYGFDALVIMTGSTPSRNVSALALE